MTFDNQQIELIAALGEQPGLSIFLGVGFLVLFIFSKLEGRRSEGLKGKTFTVQDGSREELQVKHQAAAGRQEPQADVNIFPHFKPHLSPESPKSVASVAETVASKALNASNDVGGIKQDISLIQVNSEAKKSFFQRLANIFSSTDAKELQQKYVELEELLITADVGVATAGKIIESIKAKFSDKGSPSESDVISELRNQVVFLLGDETAASKEINWRGKKPYVAVMVGVNGAGKTTTVGKLSYQLSRSGAKVLVAACDTFRAAAANQLESWANTSGVEIEQGAENDRPATVAYRALSRAVAEGFDVVIIDTAGRLHNRSNLMNELAALNKSITKHVPDAPHDTFLVVDGASGQNALQQAKEFSDCVPLTGVIITKLDGSAKGGVVVSIHDQTRIPIRYVGVGEKVGDIRTFNSQEFVSALLG